jgi:hypothetical protein
VLLEIYFEDQVDRKVVMLPELIERSALYLLLTEYLFSTWAFPAWPQWPAPARHQAELGCT